MDARDKLIVALDVDNASRALELFAALRASVGMFKIGMQLFTAAGPDLVRRIIGSGGRVFLDLKYHDIPNTVSRAGIEATRLGVSIFNVHASGGREMMQRTAAAVAEVAEREKLARPKVLSVTLLTSIDRAALDQVGIPDEPPKVVARLATLARAAGLDGVVASAQEVRTIRDAIPQSDFVIVTPAIRQTKNALQDQRRVMTVGEAIQAGADYVVIGRPILEADDPANAAGEMVEAIANALAATADPSDLVEQSRGQSVHSA